MPKHFNKLGILKWYPLLSPVLALLLIVAFVAACDTENYEESQIPSDFWSVEPGVKLGGGLIGGDYERLRVGIGRQEYFIELEADEFGDFYCDFGDWGVGATIRDRDRDGVLDYTDEIVEMYGFYPYEGQTPEGIRRGSSEDFIREIYGEPDYISPSGTIWEYDQLGIAFNFFEGYLDQIRVYAPK